MSTSEAPPAYGDLPTHGGDWAKLPSNLNGPQLDRVRRFLRFCLVVDYGLTTSTKGYLTGEEWSYFMRLARLVTKEGIAFRKHGLRDEDLQPDSESKTVQREFHQPVWSLDVPLSIARSLLILFPRRVRANGEHGSVLKRNNAHTMPEFATRLLTDREILFDALFDGPNDVQLRTELEAANRKLEKQFFVSLHSPSDYKLTAHGQDLDAYFRYDPSERQMTVLYGEQGIKEKFSTFMGSRKQAQTGAR